MPDSTINVPRQPYSRMNKSISGAKINVPNPEPATAIPVEMYKVNKIGLSFNSNLKVDSDFRQQSRMVSVRYLLLAIEVFQSKL